MALPLKYVQTLLYRLITAPNGVAEGLGAEGGLRSEGLKAIVSGDDRLSPEDRVEIYANMYFYRLLEVLSEDYPATLAVLGETNFHNLITGYLIEYPPNHPSVIGAGKSLAAFLRDHPLRRIFPFLADLASLERAAIDVFCAADAPLLEASELQAVSPDRWGRIKMRRIPATAILKTHWAVAEVLRAVEEKRDWQRPARRSGDILVWRRNSKVEYRELDDRESSALAILSRPIEFQKVCEVLAGDLAEDTAPREIGNTLARWLSEGILAPVEHKPRREAKGSSLVSTTSTPGTKPSFQECPVRRKRGRRTSDGS